MTTAPDNVWESADPADVAAIRAWFDDWGRRVAAMDFAGSRPLFRDDVVGFGTWMDMVEGLDALEARQWRSIWPTIEGFTHLTADDLKVTVSSDRCMAVGLVIWTSTGFDPEGSRFERPGRTTAVFTRRDAEDPWRCIHTHVSLFRGVPQQSHGRR